MDAIRARLDAATPGPRESDRNGMGVFTINEECFGGPIYEVGDPYPRGYNSPSDNMDLIAHAPGDIAALLAVAEAARAYRQADGVVAAMDGAGGSALDAALAAQDANLDALFAALDALEAGQC